MITGVAVSVGSIALGSFMIWWGLRMRRVEKSALMMIVLLL